MKVINYHKDGRITETEAENIYHAQNIMVYSFLILYEKYENDVVFSRIQFGSMEDLNVLLDKSDALEIFAYRTSNGIVMRNTSKDFFDQCAK